MSRGSLRELVIQRGMALEKLSCFMVSGLMSIVVQRVGVAEATRRQSQQTRVRSNGACDGDINRGGLPSRSSGRELEPEAQNSKMQARSSGGIREMGESSVDILVL